MMALRGSTPVVFGLLLALYGLALLPALWLPGYLDTPMGVLVLLPFLSVYVLHAIGLPGLLVNGGACGWGWCSPTLLGWCVVAVLWLALAWVVAASLSRGLARIRRHRQPE